MEINNILESRGSVNITLNQLGPGEALSYRFSPQRFWRRAERSSCTGQGWSCVGLSKTELFIC